MRGCIIGVVLLLPALARAGNDDAIPIGNTAAVTGGAVVATVDDSSALYHNPAGMGFDDDDQLDGSASLFVLRRYDYPALVQPEGERAIAGEQLDLSSVPSTLGFVRAIRPGLRVGLGIFVPQQESSAIRASYSPDGMGRDLLYVVALDYAVYRIAAGLAGRIGDTLSIGASLYGVYSEASVGAQASGGIIDSPMSGAFFTVSGEAEVAGVGLGLQLGLQWRPIPELAIGVSLRSPSFQIFTHYDQTSITGAGGAGAAGAFVGLDPVDVTSNEWGFRMTEPFQARLGLALRLDRGWVAVEGELQHAIEDEGIGLDLERRYNLRAGGMAHLTDTLSLGVGVFTDRSSRAGILQGGDARIHFYGGSLGLQFVKRHAMAEDRNLELGTTVALRYAYGSGRQTAFAVRDTRDFDMLFGEADTSATIHEIGLHLGSTLSF